MGVSEDEGLSIESALDIAEALNTGILRVWAGCKDSNDTDKSHWKRIINESRRIAEMVAVHDIKLVYEFH